MAWVKEKRLLGTGLDNSNCIPYVSEYSDCSDSNACSGCDRCTCDENGRWACQRVYECPQEADGEIVDDLVLSNALDNLYTGLERKKSKKGPGTLVPSPPKAVEDLLLVPDIKFDFDEDLRTLLARNRRSIREPHNDTVRFYETIDEINEDTLKHSNFSGTLEARKIKTDGLDKLSRRVGIVDHYNTSDPLHIEYNQPHEFEHHIAENKVDSKHPLEDTINGVSHEEIHKILGNYSQNVKNKDLSKLVVNELIRGKEIIGDKNVTPLSNITFTPENDTLIAMAFIAGNLLNKLWDMEKNNAEDSFETEELKRQKINDLLELFKEPLSLRQERFLKNALEKLSHIVDKNTDITNVSLCTNFENTDVNKLDVHNCTTNKTKNEDTTLRKIKDTIKNDQLENQNKATADAIYKINDVLNLIKKYENVQKSLSALREPQSRTNNQKLARSSEEHLLTDENVSLNLFGSVLEKITKLLSPNENNKKVAKKLKRFNLLRQDDIAKKNLERIFNVDLGNSSLSTKDKIITDYLSNVERHPNCIFSHLQKPVVTPLTNIEGSILYNLSEFFKIKSFADLLNLVNEKQNVGSAHTILDTTIADYPTTSTQSSTDAHSKDLLKVKLVKPNSTKEKLKNDLRNILQDLVELQAEHGVKTKSKINIAAALPCIYNILHANNDGSNQKINSTVNTSSLDKIESFIESLKADMKFTLPSRRTNINKTPRPKSAIIWERAIKNLDRQNKQATRRNFNQNQKSLVQLKNMMDKVELSGNSYKNAAIQSGVAPSERLILLKTLQADVKQYINVLENINGSVETVTNLPLDEQNEFKEFIENAAINMNLNRKVINEIAKSLSKSNNFIKNNKDTKAKGPIGSKQKMMMTKWEDMKENNDFKIKRDQIINQLIINRLKLYIRTKEENESDLNTDTNYGLAKRIIFYLENGNITLAKELFKVLLESKDLNTRRNKFTEYQIPLDNRRMGSRGLKLLDPIIKVEDQKKVKMLTQDYFLKQLWNLKELRE